MSNNRHPHLFRCDSRPITPNACHKVVFIHGMASSCQGAFQQFAQHLETLDTAHQFDLWAFDYETDQSFAHSADQLVQEIINHLSGSAEISLLGHSMGGLVARMAVLRHKLPYVRRILTLATPNHGAINGTQLNFLGQLIALFTRRISPLYIRKQGVFDLVNAHNVMKNALNDMATADISRIDEKLYVSIPAQYYHTKRQLGDPAPSMIMGGTALSIAVINRLLNQKLITLTPVHDGIVEERSNQLSPAPVGSTSEASFMPTRQDATKRVLHASHEAAADHDHVTITSCYDIADLVHAVLVAPDLDENSVCEAMTGHPNRIRIRPHVV